MLDQSTLISSTNPLINWHEADNSPKIKPWKTLCGQVKYDFVLWGDNRLINFVQIRPNNHNNIHSLIEEFKYVMKKKKASFDR